MRSGGKVLRYGAIGLMVVGVGCSGNEAPELASGNAALGIAKFAVEDGAHKTSVVGLAADGQEVGRLDLVHGRFALTEIFKDDYPGESAVDGRKLDVTIRGTKKAVWETAGYEPSLHMPAHPPSEVELAAFLADPHVKPLLDQWGIGYEPFAGTDGEIAYTLGTSAGSTRLVCSGQTDCGSFVRGGNTLTMNTCGGGASADKAIRLGRSTPTFSYDEYNIDQCCPTGSGGQSNPWFGQKSCPTTTTQGACASGQSATTCGCAASTAACKSCTGYPANSGSFCDISIESGSNDRYCYNESPKVLAFTLASGAGPTTGTATVGEMNTPTPVPSCTLPGTCNNNVCTGRTVNVNMGGDTAGFTGLTGGGCSGTSTQCYVTMSANQTVTPTFNLAGYYTVNGGAQQALQNTQSTGATSPTIHFWMKNSSGGQTTTLLSGTCATLTNNGYDVTCTGASSTVVFVVTYPTTGANRHITFNNP